MSGEADMSAAFREFLASQGYDEDGMFDVEEMELAFETGMLVRAAAPAEPPPEPAAAMAETRAMRSVLSEVLASFEQLSDGRWHAKVGDRVLTQWTKRAGLPT
jgi:hypothetical protein